MRVFAVLLLAVAATSAAPSLVSTMPTLIEVYRAPLAEKDYFQPEEVAGLKGLYDQPFVVAFQKAKNEVQSFFLQKGIQTIYEDEQFAHLRHQLLNNVEKVAFYMSAARYLHIPQLTMPINMVVPHKTMPGDKEYHMAEKKGEGEFIPFVFIVRKDKVVGDFEKLYKVGKFSFTEEKFQTIEA